MQRANDVFQLLQR